MSRKAKEIERAKQLGTFSTPGCLVATLGYSQIKHPQLPTNIAIVLWLPKADVERHALTLQERLGHLLPAVQRVLMTAEAGACPPDAVFIVDCTPLIPAGACPHTIVDAEGTVNGPLGKLLGKPVGRLLEKMLTGHRGRVTLVTFEGGAQLALRLLQAAQNDHGLKEGALDRLVLLHPRLSAAAVNTLLTKPVKTQMVVDVYYESEAALDKRDVMVRHTYAKGRSRILVPDPIGATYSHGGGLYMSLLSNRRGLREGASELEMNCLQVNPEEADSVGQSVFWGELTFEMSRATKMPTAVLVDLDPYKIAQAALAASAPSESVQWTPPVPSEPSAPRVTPSAQSNRPPAASDASAPASRWVGALVLRGNRCVLVRSLASPPEWSGMRIPYVELGATESPIDGAMRAASRYCDIDGQAELEVLPHIPPAALYVDGPQSERLCVLVYALYSVQPPQQGPLEDADLTDEDDLYDWYELTRLSSDADDTLMTPRLPLTLPRL